MISGRIKNNIYALISLSVIILTLISFVLITGFMVDMNSLVFNINGSASGDNNVLLDVSGYDNIKNIFESKLNN